MVEALFVAVGFICVSAFIIPAFGLVSPLFIFAATQTIMAVGTLTILDPSIPADVVYRQLILLTTITLYGWSTIAALAHNGYVCHRVDTPAAQNLNVDVLKPGKLVWIGIIGSILISLLYFAQVGGMTFLYGLQAAFTGQGDAADIATMRLSAYSGEAYFAPGYINQFKNSLLPALAAVALTYRLRQRKNRAIDAGLILLTALLLLGTGQRGAFVLAVLLVLIYIYWINGGKATGRMVLAAGAGVALFSIASVANLRESESESSFVGSSITAMWKRGMEEQQGSAVAGFRYIYSLPVTNGQEWLEGLGGLLPGPGGSSLASEIFETVYGSDRGTAPPSLWGSIYHNFGFVGTLVAVPILVAILVWISEFTVRASSRNTLEIAGFAGVTVCVGTWVAGDPMFLFNSGIVVYAGLWWFGRVQRLRMTDDAGGIRRTAFPRGQVSNSVL